MEKGDASNNLCNILSSNAATKLKIFTTSSIIIYTNDPQIFAEPHVHNQTLQSELIIIMLVFNSFQNKIYEIGPTFDA